MTFIFKIHGINTTLELYDSKVVIKPNGLLGLGKTEQTVLFSSISNIDFKEVDLLSGYIRFCETGHNFTSINVWNAANHSNTFMYAWKPHNKVVCRIKDYVEMRVNDKGMYPSPPPENVAAELNRLKVDGFQSLNVLSNPMIRRIIVFIGWGLSAFSFMIALAGLTNPGAEKFISLAFFGWGLIFLPPFWDKTIKYGLPVNIITRIVSFILLPFVSMSIAISNGYQPTTVSVSEVSTKAKQSPKVFKAPLQVKQSPKVSDILTTCEQKVKDAAAIPSMQDSVGDVDPAIASCRSIQELEAANSKFPTALDGAPVLEYLSNRCQDNISIKNSVICSEVLKASKPSQSSISSEPSESPISSESNEDSIGSEPSEDSIGSESSVLSNFENCKEANRAGVSNVPVTPGYIPPGWSHSADRDKDGIACERK
jgi:hypothetical protein